MLALIAPQCASPSMTSMHTVCAPHHNRITTPGDNVTLCFLSVSSCERRGMSQAPGALGLKAAVLAAQVVEAISGDVQDDHFLDVGELEQRILGSRRHPRAS